jgi:hypothetical protein
MELPMEKINLGDCVMCNKKVFFEDFKDEMEQREFKFSKTCHSCQFKMFSNKNYRERKMTLDDFNKFIRE